MTRSRWKEARPGLAVLLLVVALTAPTAAERGAADLETAQPSDVGLSAERLARLDAGMQRMVDDGKLAGIVTILARRGKVVHVDTVGVKNVETGSALHRDSIFRIFSMTKPIVGAAMMMLYEEGKWRINDPVSKYIPEFADLDVYIGDNADGSMKREALGRPMRMRHLMTHTAGLGYTLNPRHPVHQMFLDQRVLDPEEPLQTMITRMAAVPLLAQPGTRYVYSAAIDVQGYLVEKLSGQPLAEFLDERIFAPLGMVDTAFYVPPEKLDRVARQHMMTDGSLALAEGRRSQVRTTPPAGPSGGGGLYGTADDYLRFAQMMLNGGELDGVRLLGTRTVEMMRTNHMSEEARQTRGPGQGWGLGFSVVMDAAAAGESLADGSYFWLGAAGTWFWIDPANDLTFVGMIQHAGAAIQEVQGLSRSLVYQSIVAP